MQDPDPKCRHFVISWHFMAFWHVCQKANCITKSAFSAFSRLFPPFRLFHRIRLLDFSALVAIWMLILSIIELTFTTMSPRIISSAARLKACSFNLVIPKICSSSILIFSVIFARQGTSAKYQYCYLDLVI